MVLFIRQQWRWLPVFTILVGGWALGLRSRRFGKPGQAAGARPRVLLSVVQSRTHSMRILELHNPVGTGGGVALDCPGLFNSPVAGVRRFGRRRLGFTILSTWTIGRQLGRL